MINSVKIITIPGSKSLTNRALLLAALAPGESNLHNLLRSDDTEVMIQALKQLGVAITQDPHDKTHLTIQGNLQWKKPSKTLYLGNAGTAVRFLTAILANQPFESILDGDQRMRERPLSDLLTALLNLGADINCPTGCPPLTIRGKPLSKNKTHLNGTTSSQYLSALLMLGPLLPDGLILNVDGKLTSASYIDLTLDLMNKFCDQKIITENHQKFTVSAQPYHPCDLTLEADASSATYFWGIAALTGQTILTPNLARTSKQADIQLLPLLEKMGCTIEENNDGITVTGPSKPLTPLGTLDANAFPDGAMTLAVLAAFAHGKTTLIGLHTLKHKESDRLTAMATELKKIGIHAETTEASITIHGNPDSLHPATIATYNDHRMAMSFGMAKCRLPDLIIENPNCADKTYPSFWDDLKKTLA